MKYLAQEDPCENGFLTEKFHPSKHRDANLAFHKLIKTFSFFGKKTKENQFNPEQTWHFPYLLGLTGKADCNV